MEPIISTDNSRVKEARSLQRKRQRTAKQACLVEGLRLCGDAWAAGARFQRLFFVPDAVEASSSLAALLTEMTAAGVETLPCTEQVFRSLADTVTPQGIAGVVDLPALSLPASPGLVLILDGIADPGNAGTLLRSAEAAGVDGVLFGPGSVDAFNPKVVRAGMGAHFRLPLGQCGQWADLVDLLPPHLPLFLADAQGDLAYDQVDWTQPAGLILGSEATGASPQARSAARAIHIPMAGATESLNAAVAGAVVLFEAARQRRQRT
jgi:TrmH family RNA methyltransferase